MDLKEPDLLERTVETSGRAEAGREILFRRAVGRVSQPLILMIDVLEHVADDSEAGLREMQVDTDQGGTCPLMTRNAE